MRGYLWPAGRRNGRERGGDDGFAMDGLRGEKKQGRGGTFVLLFSFGQGKGGVWWLSVFGRKKIKEDCRRLASGSLGSMWGIKKKLKPGRGRLAW